jgi:hypothetical protein
VLLPPHADVHLPGAIDSKIVMHRGQPIVLGGWANPGGPFKLTTTGSNTITFDNVMVDDVWLCSGQRNTELKPLLEKTRVADKERTSGIGVGDFQLCATLSLDRVMESSAYFILSNSHFLFCQST